MEPNLSASELPLPATEGPIRFAIGPPDGLTSNSWRFWTNGQDVYLACRDSFRELKVSLHPEGGWRMAFTAEAVKARPELKMADGSRDWEVWNEPPDIVPDAKIAFRLLFPTNELAVRPEHRTTKHWKNTLFIENAPEGSGKITVVSLFITTTDADMNHETEPSIHLARLPLPDGRFAQLVVHADPEMNIDELVLSARQAAFSQMIESNDVPEESVFLFFGNHPDGARFLVSAQARPSEFNSALAETT